MKKIEGWVPPLGDKFYGTPGIRVRTIAFGDVKGHAYDHPAVLVIGDGDTAPKVLTEEEHTEVCVMLVTEFTKIINAIQKKVAAMSIDGMELDLSALEQIAQNPRFADKARVIARKRLDTL